MQDSFTLARFRVPFWAPALFATCLVAVLALFGLDAKSFWLDEADSVLYASTSQSIPRVVLVDGGNSALYYLILHVWLRFGSSDWYVRFLSVLPALLAVPCLFLVARRLFDNRVASIAALLLAVNPFVIAYAQDARAYTLLLLAATASTLCFVACLQETRPFRWSMAYAITGVLMVYTHLFGVFVLAAHAVALALDPAARARWRVLLVPGLAMAALLLPLAYTALRKGPNGLRWIPPLSAPSMIGFFQELAGGALLLLVFCLALVYAFALSRPRPHNAATGVIVTLSWLLVPLVLALLVSEVVRPVIVARYLIVSLPALVLGAAVGIARLRAAPAIITLCVVLALSAKALAQYYAQAPLEDWRGVAAFITAHARAGDVVVCNPSWYAVPLAHELARRPVSAEPIAVFNARADDATFLASLGTMQRVWVVRRSLQGQAAEFARRQQGQLTQLRTALHADALVLRTSIPPISMELYARVRPSPQAP